jgi:uncharacterized repeat protein (TIGR01451 family)
MLGGAGDDALRARDGGRDTLLQCGTGTDSASIDEVDPAPVECESVSTRPVADLSLALSDAPDPARLTQTVEYRFTVRNAGPEPATGVVVATTLPAGATAAPAAGCSAAGQVVTCALGTVPVGGSAEGVLSVRHGSTGTHTVSSTVDSEADDPQPGDDTATATTTVTDPLADVSVSLSDSPDPVAAPGTDVTYTAEVTNHGPDTAQGAFVTFDVPAGGVAAGCTPVAGGRRCELGDVAAGGSRTASITVRWSTEGAFEVTARAGSATADPNPGNNADTESTAVGGADLSVSITANRDTAVAGEAGPLYTVQVSNAGPQAAEDVSFTVLFPDGWGSFAVPPGCTVDLGPTRLTCPLGSIPAGGSVSRSFDVSWRDPGPQQLTVTTTAARPADPDLSDNTDSHVTTVVAPAADLSVSITANRDTAVAGEAGPLYTVQVSNAGPQTAENVSFTVLFPDGWGSFAVPPGCTVDFGPTRLTCPLGSIPAGGSVSRSFDVSWRDPGPQQLTVTTTAARPPDPNTANNSASHVTTVVAPAADLSVQITANRDDAVAGEAGPLYTVQVSNAGPQTAENVSFTVLFPEGWGSFANPAGCTVTFGPTRLTCPLGSIPAGGSVSRSFDVSWRDPGPQELSVTTAAARPPDPNTANNSDSHVTTVVAPA